MGTAVPMRPRVTEPFPPLVFDLRSIKAVLPAVIGREPGAGEPSGSFQLPLLFRLKKLLPVLAAKAGSSLGLPSGLPRKLILTTPWSPLAG